MYCRRCLLTMVLSGCVPAQKPADVPRPAARSSSGARALLAEEANGRASLGKLYGATAPRGLREQP